MKTASKSDEYPKYQGALGQATPSIEIDEMGLPDELQLPQPSEDGGYCDILWHFFYRPGGIGTQAKIINKDFALVLAQELSPHFQTTAAALGQYLQSDVELGQLRRIFYLWIGKSKINKDSDIYQAVKKCGKEITNWGRIILEEYESAMNRDRAGDETIARLRTDLFLDLSLGEELDLLIDGHGMVNESGQPIRSRLEWWIRIDEQSANLELRDRVGAGLNQERRLTVNIAGDIISKLRSQGIILKTGGATLTSVLHVKTLASCKVAEQSREDQPLTAKRSSSGQNGLNLTRRPKKLSKRHSVDQITTPSNSRKDKRTQRSNRGGKAGFKTKPPNNSKKIFKPKADTGDEDGSGSGNDTERISTPEMNEIVAKIRSEIGRINPGEGAKEVEMDNTEN